ncbi:J domain-containing protein [Cognatilysobacter bugurensis]|uniref:Membrane protein n=1 Tax=Cognatilysobacter bugurensis TaxID=543356 RepID=A0A918T2R1_9GAMM|nr:DnaJ domain-containing protein [Lysobacter bugurensis]GHA85909.1 membrane protein [Lysobacter bugurensis]
MRWTGKLLGFLAGAVLLRANPLLGAVIGLLIGHALDAGWFATRRDDPYAVLGVRQDASDAEVEQAYRRLMARHHPDRQIGVGEVQKRKSERRARDINRAYDRVRALRGRR